MGKDVIVACEFPGRGQLEAFLDRLGADRPYVKIGMELFYAEGPEIVRLLKSRGCRVFLDLKLHDIPNTVRRAMAGLADLGADMVNVHAACGEGFLTVTPGVRFPEGDTGDQKRVMSPLRAKEAGSDYIVVGRPITAAPDPAAAYARCVREFVG